MIVTPVPHGLDLLKSDLVRSPGIHASDIWADYYARLDPKHYAYDSPPDPMLLAMGTAWEKHLEYLLLANGITAHRPDEFISPEGIAFSPDILLFNGVVRLGEIKWTSKSTKDMPTSECNNLPSKLDRYVDQMKLYAYWLELQHGWLAIAFMNTPWAPDLRCFNLEWTERELQETHSKFMRHAREMGAL